MKSTFNAVFETFMTEAALPAPQLPATPSNNALTTVTSSLSTNTLSGDNTSKNKSELANTVTNLNQSIKNAISTAMNVAPEILKNLKAQEKFWNGQAGNGVNLLIQTLEDYNSKKRLNALYGVVDYMKSKNPTIHAIPPCEFLATIENKLNETE